MKTQLTLVAFLTLLSTAVAADRPPNIIIVYADDLGYGDLGCYGSKVNDTPNLDRLAREGRRFSMNSTTWLWPVCSASRTALLTGCYPNRLGIHGALGPQVKHGIADGEVTLAMLLKSKGYATGMAGKWHLGHHPRFLPTRHGFDEYLGLPYSNDMWPQNPSAKPGTYPPLPLIEGEKTIDPDVTAEAQGRLTALYTERGLLVSPSSEKDWPSSSTWRTRCPTFRSSPGRSFAGRRSTAPTATYWRRLDWSMGEILKALAANSVAENTLVIFSSDNGPWLSYGDHAGSAGPLREGKVTCWEGGLRVPCIMRWPSRLKAGTTSDAMFMTLDLFPTIAGLVGAKLPAHPIDGLDVWPLIAGETGAKNPHDAYVYYFEQSQLQAVVDGDGRWKLQLPHKYQALAGRPGGHGGSPSRYEVRTIERPELYDLVNDLGETTDVAARHPEIVSRLLGVAERSRAELGDSITKRTGRGIRPAATILP